MRHRFFRGLSSGVWLFSMLLAWSAASAQDLKSFEKRITVKVLPNGLTLVICERHDAPVFSYATFVDAGDVNDPSGESGLAHMFEHLAFKGTTQIGTTDYAAEKIALQKVEDANDAYEAEYLKPVGRDEKKLAKGGASEAPGSKTRVAVDDVEADDDADASSKSSKKARH